MANAKTGTHICKLKPPEVPEDLQKGVRVYKFDDVADSASGSLLRLFIDPKGHILYWMRDSLSKEIGMVYECLDFVSICDARVGKYAQQPKGYEHHRDKLSATCGLEDPVDECLFSVVFLPALGPDCKFVEPKFLTFIAASANAALDAIKWCNAIFSVATNLWALNGSVLHFLGQHYAKLRYCPNSDGCISTRELVRSYSAGRNEKTRVENALNAAGLPSTKYETIPVDQFTEERLFLLYRHLTQRGEVLKVFKSLQKASSQSASQPRRASSDSPGVLTVEDFVSFLNQEQRDPRLNEILYPYYNKISAQRLINLHEPNAQLAAEGLLSFEGFLRYLLSDDNAVLSEAYYDLRPEDLNEPLSHYLVQSSHNTYLYGPQIGGPASEEMYRQVLLQGCRCVELDILDGVEGSDDPIITHRKAFAGKISFRGTLEAIAESAFKTSEYPVMLSFENHCNAVFQAHMVKHLREVFGDMLLTEPLPTNPLEPGVPLPAPSMLKRKILIKNARKDITRQESMKSTEKVDQSRTPRDKPSTGTANPGDAGERLATNEEKAGGGGGIGGKRALSREEISDDPPSDRGDSWEGQIDYDGSGDSSDGGEEISEEYPERAPHDRTVPAPELSELVLYLQPVKLRFTEKKPFELPEKRNLSFQVVSLNENFGYTCLKMEGTELVNFNKRQLSRIYPKGTRVDSSNFIPQAFWNAGCQMVALNYQTYDLGMQLNLGVFERNGRCGYLLKPECMRRRDRHFDPFETSSVENVIPNRVAVQIISGQLLGCSGKTYVLVEMFGHCVDNSRSFWKTKKVDTSVNPLYESKFFEFPKVILPEMATLRLALCDENGKMLGQRFLPVSGLRPGYRHIPLRNARNQPLGLPTLFVRIRVNDYVPDAHMDFAEALTNPIAFVSQLEKNERLLKDLIDEMDEEERVQRQQDGEDGVEGEGGASHATSDMFSSPNVSSTASRVSALGSTNPLAVDLANRSAAGRGSNAFLPSGASRISERQMSGTKKFGSLSIATGNLKRPPAVFSGTLLDSYDFKIPSCTTLNEDKQYQILLKKQDREIDQLRKKQLKDWESVQQRLLKRGGVDDLRPTPKSLSSLFALRFAKKSGTPRTNGHSDDLSTSNGQLVPDQEKPQSPKRSQQLSDAEHRVCLRYLREEVELLKQQKANIHTLRQSLVMQSQRRNLKTLETLYNKQREEMTKGYMEDKKVKISDLARTTEDKVEFLRLKKEVEDDFFRIQVDAGKRLKNIEASRREELEKAYDELNEKLKTVHESDVEAVEKEYADKAAKGEFTVEVATRL